MRVDLRAPICRARFGGFWGHIGAQSVQVQFWGSFLHLRTSCANLATMPQNQAPQISGRKSTRKMTSRTEGVRIWGPHAPLTSQQPVGRAGGQRPKHVGRLGTDPPHAPWGSGGQSPYRLGPRGYSACKFACAYLWVAILRLSGQNRRAESASAKLTPKIALAGLAM